MRFLLDTHTFLWFINGDERLSEQSRRLIENADNDVLISVVSLWEIAIKVSLNKLELAQAFEVLIPRELADNKFTQLPITVAHLIQLSKLPFHHRDPFDRLLIAQSLTEELPLVSKDRKFNNYGVARVW
jgi:PIN domain nuclease of toxin-antitoxin system